MTRYNKDGQPLDCNGRRKRKINVNEQLAQLGYREANSSGTNFMNGKYFIIRTADLRSGCKRWKFYTDYNNNIYEERDTVDEIVALAKEKADDTDLS